MNIDVNITSNRELIENASNDAILRALKAIGLQAEGYAKMKCPTDTGRLKNSITNKVEGRNSVAIATPVEYGKFVEMGTSKQKPQPFLKPAITEHVDEYQRMIEQFLKGDE